MAQPKKSKKEAAAEKERATKILFNQIQGFVLASDDTNVAATMRAYQNAYLDILKHPQRVKYKRLLEAAEAGLNEAVNALNLSPEQASQFQENLQRYKDTTYILHYMRNPIQVAKKDPLRANLTKANEQYQFAKEIVKIANALDEPAKSTQLQLAAQKWEESRAAISAALEQSRVLIANARGEKLNKLLARHQYLVFSEDRIRRMIASIGHTPAAKKSQDPIVQPESLTSIDQEVVKSEQKSDKKSVTNKDAEKIQERREKAKLKEEAAQKKQEAKAKKAEEKKVEKKEKRAEKESKKEARQAEKREEKKQAKTEKDEKRKLAKAEKEEKRKQAKAEKREEKKKEKAEKKEDSKQAKKEKSAENKEKAKKAKEKKQEKKSAKDERKAIKHDKKQAKLQSKKIKNATYAATKGDTQRDLANSSDDPVKKLDHLKQAARAYNRSKKDWHSASRINDARDGKMSDSLEYRREADKANENLKNVKQEAKKLDRQIKADAKEQQKVTKMEAAQSKAANVALEGQLRGMFTHAKEARQGGVSQLRIAEHLLSQAIAENDADAKRGLLHGAKAHFELAANSFNSALQLNKDIEAKLPAANKGATVFEVAEVQKSLAVVTQKLASMPDGKPANELSKRRSTAAEYGKFKAVPPVPVKPVAQARKVQDFDEAPSEPAPPPPGPRRKPN